MPRFQWLWGLVLVPLTVQAAELRLGARAEVTHPGKAQEVHLSGAAVAVGRDGGQTFSPIHVLSHALKAYAPSIAISPTGEFVVVWHEEQFPVTKTVVQPMHLRDTR
jgi:hypothetical protein